jgi:hypothetical protein
MGDPDGREFPGHPRFTTPVRDVHLAPEVIRRIATLLALGLEESE